MPRRRGLDCGTLTTATRCTPCRARKKQVRNAGASAARDVVTAWRQQHGNICPGWGRPPHPAADLTADHRTPLHHGGDNSAANLTVLCRSCNARKGATT